MHEEVKDRFHGCGSPIPPALQGVTVLDLGCGGGRDCCVLSQLVGSAVRVLGVDMTDRQLAVARRHLDFHAERFGFANVEFHQGHIEDLASVGIGDESVDVVVSNCVLNLSPDKPRVFAEIFRVLKPGGELYFSDVFAARRVPPALLEALYTEDFRRIMAASGCADARVVARAPVTLSTPEFEAKIGFVGFSSLTIRAVKLPLEDRCEDYGQIAVYRGTLPTSTHAFDLDEHHRFPTGKPVLVCGNTADILGGSRYAAHFEIIGDASLHHGLSPCGPGDAQAGGGMASGGSCC